MHATWTLADRSTGERGLLTRIEFDEREYLATIVNNHSRAIEITVLQALACQAQGATDQALARLEVVPTADTFNWSWAAGQDDLDYMLWPVVRTAADLLTSDDLLRVRECARTGCDWLFVDLSKNHSRRWCSMNMCGSRVKARRYYQRRKVMIVKSDAPRL